MCSPGHLLLPWHDFRIKFSSATTSHITTDVQVEAEISQCQLAGTSYTEWALAGVENLGWLAGWLVGWLAG